MARQAEEVNWDGLDKRKFFIYGAGMFSGVTMALYPLSVIKTKQMTLPGISGGFKGVGQTASTIMRGEGLPGFYRGFSTVIFGTIPARAVYLTTLEWTKTQVTKGVADLGLAEPTVAGMANFAGGALASLATQSVTVPIDVISQKQIVHGDETVVARHQHGKAGPAHAGVAQPGAGAGAAGGAGGAGPSTSGAGGGGAGQGAGAASAPASASASAAGAEVQQGASAAAGRSGTGAGASTSGRAAVSTAAASAAEGQAAQAAAQAQQGVRAAVGRIGPLQMVRLIIKEEGLAGLYRGFGASVATFVPSSAVWWGAYGLYQKLLWRLAFGNSASAVAGGSSGSGGSGGKAGEGVGADAEALAPGRLPPGHSTGEVVAVQVAASVLAGCTSSLVTTPLDLIKTRIQVSYKHDGATPSFVEVVRQILREDGAAGLLRGAVPRMINASLWGTCMVSVYEHLKRVCQKEEQ